MSDIDEIRRIIAEYCFATDTGDTERWVSLFADDILWAGGPFGQFLGKDEARAYHSRAGDASKRFRHLTTNSIIKVDGKSASALSYVLVFEQADATPVIVFSGIYEDEFVCQGGNWLFKLRRLHPHPSAVAAHANQEPS